jgi:ubiquinone/menaquinone biosynthesis C-methylase UbiE
VTDRRRARELARDALARGAPLDWFEALYAEAGDGRAVVPWDDRAPSPLLVRWLDAHGPFDGRTALDVGCGTGDNAAELARRGLAVTAFDLSPTALRVARDRYGDGVRWVEASALALPAAWSFDLVVEIYTLQVLPPPERAVAAGQIARCVAPGGRLVVIARAREPGDPPGEMPWPLTRSELERLADHGLALDSLEDLVDREDPPVRRFVATFRRA